MNHDYLNDREFQDRAHSAYLARQKGEQKPAANTPAEPTTDLTEAQVAEMYARSHAGKRFVTLDAEIRASYPGLQGILASKGFDVLHGAKPSPSNQYARERIAEHHRQRQIEPAPGSTISRHDQKAFLANIEKLASGKMRAA